MKRFGALFLVGGLGLLGCESLCGGLGDNGFCFSEAQSPLQQNVREVRAADLNADGLVDLAVLLNNESTLRLLLNSPSGAFDARDVALASLPTALTIGDLNVDGSPDVVVGLNSGVVVPLVNDGAANLQPMPSVTAPGAVVLITIEDLNQDLSPDILVGTSGFFLDGQVQSFLQSQGTFIPTEAKALNTAVPSSFHLFDLDGDGDLDLETQAFSLLEDEIIHLENLGDGQLSEPLLISGDFLETSAESVFADLDQDGAEDTITVVDKFDFTFERPVQLKAKLSSSINDSITLLGARENDSFIHSVELFELTGDEKLDTLVTLQVLEPVGEIVTRLFLVENQRNGRFGAHTEIDLPFSIDQSLATDLNADSSPDLLVVDESGALLVFPSVR